MTIQEPERAIEVYESILRKNPSDLRLATKMGEALVQTHHYAKAVSYYEAAIKDGQSSLLQDLIDLLIKLKQYDKARRLITPIVTQSTSDTCKCEMLLICCFCKSVCLPGNSVVLVYELVFVQQFVLR